MRIDWLATSSAVSSRNESAVGSINAAEHFEKGNAQFSKQKFPEALIEYRRAIQSDPRLGPARLQLAITYASVGDGPNALREYARAAELMPDDAGAQLKAGNFMLIASQYQDAQAIAQQLLAQMQPHQVGRPRRGRGR